jgi:hypothetical protein
LWDASRVYGTTLIQICNIGTAPSAAFYKDGDGKYYISNSSCTTASLFTGYIYIGAEIRYIVSGVDQGTQTCPTPTPTPTLTPTQTPSITPTPSLPTPILTSWLLQGSGTQISGTTQVITITAKDQYGNTFTSITGGVSFTFSGATGTVGQQQVNSVNFGSLTSVTFTSGVGTATMLLTKVETANVVANNSSINSNTLSVSVTVPPASPSPTPSLTPTRTPTRTPTPSSVGQCYRLINTSGVLEECTFRYFPYGGGSLTPMVDAGLTERVCSMSEPVVISCTTDPTGVMCSYCTKPPCTSTINCTSDGTCTGCT